MINKDNSYSLGYGISYPVKVNLQGEIFLSTGESNIEESIQIILRTKLGERLYLPSFGSRLSELTFEPINSETLLLARTYTEEAVEKWEQRINLKEVRVEPDLGKSLINIEIIYQIKKTRDIHSMNYPLSLQPESV